MLRGQLEKHITMELNKDIWAKDTDLEVISTLIDESWAHWSRQALLPGGVIILYSEKMLEDRSETCQLLCHLSVILPFFLLFSVSYHTPIAVIPPKTIWSCLWHFHVYFHIDYRIIQIRIYLKKKITVIVGVPLSTNINMKTLKEIITCY